eukprot:2014853-Pyramimonas_sp.AAC.1
MAQLKRDSFSLGGRGCNLWRADRSRPDWMDTHMRAVLRPIYVRRLGWRWGPSCELSCDSLCSRSADDAEVLGYRGGAALNAKRPKLSRARPSGDLEFICTCQRWPQIGRVALTCTSQFGCSW